MFGNRFWGDFNFYNRDSKDQIINVNTTSASGYTTRKMNAGLIRNRGIELSLGGEVISTKDWTWDINANISRNRNTLEELGNIQPDATGDFSTSVRYKHVRVSASFDFQIGGSLASATNMFGEASGLLASTAGNNDKGNEIRSGIENGGGVRIGGVVDNGNGQFSPMTTYLDAQTYYQSYKSLLWENYVYDASYLKMREFSVSYDVPASFLKSTHTSIKRASISFVAQNPWLIYSGVPNIDPSESGSATYNYTEGGQAASTRSFGCTVNLTF